MTASQLLSNLTLEDALMLPIDAENFFKILLNWAADASDAEQPVRLRR